MLKRIFHFTYIKCKKGYLEGKYSKLTISYLEKIIWSKEYCNQKSILTKRLFWSKEYCDHKSIVIKKFDPKGILINRVFDQKNILITSFWFVIHSKSCESLNIFKNFRHLGAPRLGWHCTVQVSNKAVLSRDLKM